MYNELKINMLEHDCDCEYAISKLSGYVTPFIWLKLYIGEGVERPHVRLWTNGTSDTETWNATEFTPPDYENGWYGTRLKYEDFAKCGEYELNAEAYDGDTRIGNRTLMFVHDGKLQSSGDWMITKPSTSWNNNVYVITQVGTSSGGGSGGGGGTGANYTVGDGISVSDENVISAKIGNGLQFVYEQNEDGTDNTEKPRKIAVKIGKGLALLDDGTIVSVPNIQNAVLIKEADAKYLLHEYNEVEYIAGNRIGYAGPLNQIITQGYVFYALYGTSPNGITIKGGNYGSGYLSDIPDMPLYQRVDFSPSAYIGSIGWTSSVELVYDSMTSTYAIYKMRYTREDGSTVEDFTIYNYNSYGGLGFGYVWASILPPGTEYQGRTFEHGCAVCRYTYRQKSSDTRYTMGINTNTTYDAYIPFASEAEYNAAVGLTYEPVTLTEVTETVTEV